MRPLSAAQAAAHEDFIAHEHRYLGIDHAALGSWWLTHWRLSVALCRTVAWSHTPPENDPDTGILSAARCVALGSQCVEILLAPDAPTDITALAERAERWLGLGASALADVMTQIVAEIPEIERLFDTDLLDSDSSSAIIEQARGLLMLRNLQAIEQMNSLQQSADYFQTRAAELEDKHRRDPLTALFNRGHLDHGHGKTPVGRGAGYRLRGAVRRRGIRHRVGGLNSEAAQVVCERLLERMRGTRHAFTAGPVTVTASLGLATHTPTTPFASVQQLVEAADRSVYVAKKAGRDRLSRHTPVDLATTA